MLKRLSTMVLTASLVITMFPAGAFATEQYEGQETAAVTEEAEPESVLEESVPEEASEVETELVTALEEIESEVSETESVPEEVITTVEEDLETEAAAAEAGNNEEADDVNVTAAEDPSKCGDNLTWSVMDGILYISGSGDMYDFESEEEVPWYTDMSGIWNIELDERVTSIGQYAFSGCSLAYYIVPEGITRIGDSAFNNSVRLLGPAGSEAEAFAGRNGNPFSALVSDPVISSVSNVNGGVKVTWNSVENAQLYCIYRRTANDDWTVLTYTDTTSFTDDSVVSGTKYFYTVQCVSEDAEVSTSTFDIAGKSITYVAMPVISSLSVGNDGITITWGKVAGAAKYRLYRKTGSGSWAKVADTTSTTYKDASTVAGTTYSYTVRCLDAAGNFVSAYDTTGKKVVYASKPVISSLSNVVGGVKLTWAKISGAATYRVYRKSGTGSWTKVADTASVTYTDKTVKSGTKYTYTVRCLNAGGQFNSGFDTAGKAITYVAAPVISSLSNVNEGVTVSWGKVTGAAKYRVYRKSGSGSWAKIADTAATSYTDKTVAAGTKYNYTVRCLDSSGATVSSFDSNGKSITYVAAPKISSVANVVGGVKVTWGKAAGAAKYRVYRKTGSGSWAKVGDTTAVTYTDKTAVSGTKYAYTVRCLDSAGQFCSGFDPAGKSITYVAAPAVKSLENVYGGVKVTWSKVTGAAKYRVYRKNGSGSWTKIADTTALSYTDKSVKNGTKYTYTVRCLDSAGNTVSSFNSTGKAITYVAAPVISSLENVNGGVKITWAKAPATAKYRVYRKTGSGSWTKIGDTTASTYTDTTTKGGTKYTYTIRCLNSAGNFVSSFSNTGKSITYVAPPKISSLTSVKDGVKVTWVKVAGASKYRVYRKTGSGSWVKKGDTTAVTYTDKTAVSGTTYTYTVRCLDSAGNPISSFDPTGKTITYSDEAFRPNFEVQLLDETDADKYAIVMQLTNYGNYEMTIYPGDAYLIDSDTSAFNRRLQLVNQSLQPLDWIKFPKNSRDFVFWEILNSPTWYDSKTTISFRFKYNGDMYRAYCSYYYGTRYYKE